MQSTTRELPRHQTRGKERGEGAEGKERLHQEEEERSTLVASSTKKTAATKLVRIDNILKFKVKLLSTTFWSERPFSSICPSYIFYPTGSMKEKDI